MEFYSGQKAGIAKKELIEPVPNELKQIADKAVTISLSIEYAYTHVLFIQFLQWLNIVYAEILLR
jgi:hypothetical protein